MELIPANSPNFLKPFVGKTPAQVLGKFFAPKQLEAIAGLMSGIVDIGVPVPPWAKQSSKQFWKHYVGLDFKPLESAEDFGVLIKVFEHAINSPAPAPQHAFEKWVSKIQKPLAAFLIKLTMQHFSDLEKSQYFAGRARAQDVIAKLENPDYLAMTKLAKLYALVSVAWKRIESQTSHAERIKWLRAEQVVNATVTDREIYQAFKLIELPGAPPGRPKSQNPDTLILENQVSSPEPKQDTARIDPT